VKRIGIVVGGQICDYNGFREAIEQMDRIIACDSGARHLKAVELAPHLLVGDMDSIEPDILRFFEESDVPTQRFRAEKDETDSELAVSLALEEDVDEIHIFANQGDRLDHLMANISLLYRIHRAGVKGFVHTDNQEIWLVEGTETITGTVGDTISFIPMGMKAEGVTLIGFQYPLIDYCYEHGTPIGISNRLAASEANVLVREGILIAIRTKETFL